MAKNKLTGVNFGGHKINIEWSRKSGRFDENDYYLFEIQPEVFNLLEKNVEINKFKNIHLYNTGLSDKEETFEINLPNYTLDKNISAFSLKKQVIDNDYEVNTIGKKAKLKCKKKKYKKKKKLRKKNQHLYYS